jgi:hypothetical protein
MATITAAPPRGGYKKAEEKAEKTEETPYEKLLTETEGIIKDKFKSVMIKGRGQMFTGDKFAHDEAISALDDMGLIEREGLSNSYVLTEKGKKLIKSGKEKKEIEHYLTSENYETASAELRSAFA